MAGQWVERPDGRWAWDKTAPAADPSPTSIMSAYAGGFPMSDTTPRSVYDPRLGNDGGGRYAEPDPIPAIDPDNPVDHVDQLQVGDGPDSWTGSEPAHGPTGATAWVPETDPNLVCCPRCGSGVHRDRLRD